MTIPTTVRRCLEMHATPFEVLAHPAAITAAQTAEAAHVSGDTLVKAVALKDGDDVLVALLPATHVLHAGELSSALGREVELAAESDFVGLFPDCDTGAVPALPLPYEVPTVVDECLFDAPRLFLESGSHRDLVALAGEDFRRLYANSPLLRLSGPRH
jgi:Ala-tRNA(Pro) deacylase